MTPDIFAEWLRRNGHQVIQTESSYWTEVGPHIFQSFPYYQVISPSPNELNVLLNHHAAIGLRYSAPWESQFGMASYHVLFTESEYPLASLSKKARHDIYRGMDASSIEPISFARLGSDGWLLRADTLHRQGRIKAESPEGWLKLCQSTHGLRGFDTWAAIVNGELAASLIAFTCGDCCSIIYQQSRTKYLPLGVNNALTFVFSNEILKRSGQPWIFYGLHSLDAPSGVDEFKFRMGYRAKPVRQRVVFHPWLSPYFNPVSHAMLRGLKRLMPGSPSLAKAEGMVRFFLEGKKPLKQQTWPEPLVHNKDVVE